MSLHLEFEPHSWYMSFAIKKDEDYNDPCEFTYNVDSKNCIVHAQRAHPSDDVCEGYAPKWQAFTDNGNFYVIDEVHGGTLKDLKQQIKQYRSRQQ